MRYPRYTTYGDDEELTAAIDRVDPMKKTGTTAYALRQGGVGNTGGGGSLLKSHECAVLFPDGATGTCCYTRGGPAWHVFRFRHPGRGQETFCPMAACHLPAQNVTERMDNTPTSISLRAQELASRAYAEAVRREQQDHFRRVMPPPGSKPELRKAQFTAKRAKEIAGRYAICVRLGDSLVPVSGDSFDTLDGANTEWLDWPDPKRFVACACRWSRRWEMPRFNPLYGNPRYGELETRIKGATGDGESSDEAE